MEKKGRRESSLALDKVFCNLHKKSTYYPHTEDSDQHGRQVPYGHGICPYERDRVMADHYAITLSQ
jgi:hypothetical protein